MDSSQTIEQKRNHYSQEIARRTPPQSRHDEYMCNMYQGLLDNIEWFLMFGGSPRVEVPELRDGLEDKSAQ